MQGSKDPKRANEVNELVALSFALTAVAALLIVRGALFYFQSWDYLNFLSGWISDYRSMSFSEALGTNVGNYNPPYMYILNMISSIGGSDLYLIKSVSVVFDILLAYFVMKIVSLKTERLNMLILAVVLAFAIPTVVLNSAMWAQCDSIYSAFSLGAVYFALRGRSKMSYVFIALALSFKLQAAFILPIFIIFIIKKKIKLSDCYMFFAVYLAMLLPALIAGAHIRDLLLVYFNQSVTYNYLTLNAINIWQFVEHVPFAENVRFANFKIAGLFISGLAVLSLLYFTYVNREKLVKTVDYIRLTFLFAVILPFLLPQMHDRFFYMADVLSLTVFLYDKRRWFVPIVTVFCSYTVYASYLMGWTVFTDYRWFAALALMFVIFIVLRDLVISLTNESNDNGLTRAG